MAREMREPRPLLVASVAFAALANLAGRFADAQVHVKAGLQLLADVRRKGAAARADELGQDMAGVAQTLARLDLQDMTFSDAAAPYNHVHSDDRMPRLAPFAHAPDPLGPAAGHLFDMLRAFLSICTGFFKGQLTDEQFRSAHARLASDAAYWEDEMRSLLLLDDDRPGGRTKGDRFGADPALRRRLLAIKLYHAMFRLTMDVGPYGSEVRWDAYLAYFERIVDAAAALAAANQRPTKSRTRAGDGLFVSLEPGLALPVFLAVTRCRHPILRRRGLAVLKRLNRHEGLWNTAAAAAVAEQWVLAEEDEMQYDLSLHPDEDERWGEDDGTRLMIERPEEWLAEGKGPGHGGAAAARFREARHTWDGWTPVPEESRSITEDMHVDPDLGRIELVLYSRDGQGAMQSRTLVTTY